MTRKISRDPNALTAADVPALLREYRNADAMAKQVADRAAKMKERLREVLVTEGFVDDKGHLWLEVEGVEGVVTGLKHEKRVREELNREAMEKWLREHNLWDQCSTTIEVMDDDAFWALVYDKKVPQQVIKKNTETTTSWAFRVV